MPCGLLSAAGLGARGRGDSRRVRGVGKRRGERGISSAAPTGPLPPPPQGRQGLGSATSKRRGSMFKLGPDSGEGDPRPESPWGWGSFLSQGSTAPITWGPSHWTRDCATQGSLCQSEISDSTNGGFSGPRLCLLHQFTDFPGEGRSPHQKGPRGQPQAPQQL